MEGAIVFKAMTYGCEVWSPAMNGGITHMLTLSEWCYLKTMKWRMLGLSLCDHINSVALCQMKDLRDIVVTARENEICMMGCIRAPCRWAGEKKVHLFDLYEAVHVRGRVDRLETGGRGQKAFK